MNPVTRTKAAAGNIGRLDWHPAVNFLGRNDNHGVALCVGRLVHRCHRRAKQAIALLRHRKFSEAAALAATIDDPIARKLVEWVMLRDSDSPAGFDRYAAFIQANADWPSIPLLRRRAEATPVAGAAGGLNRPPFPWQATCQRDPGLCEPRRLRITAADAASLGPCRRDVSP